LAPENSEAAGIVGRQQSERTAVDSTEPAADRPGEAPEATSPEARDDAAGAAEAAAGVAEAPEGVPRVRRRRRRRRRPPPQAAQGERAAPGEAAGDEAVSPDAAAPPTTDAAPADGEAVSEGTAPQRPILRLRVRRRRRRPAALGLLPGPAEPTTDGAATATAGAADAAGGAAGQRSFRAPRRRRRHAPLSAVPTGEPADDASVADVTSVIAPHPSPEGQPPRPRRRRRRPAVADGTALPGGEHQAEPRGPGPARGDRRSEPRQGEARREGGARDGQRAGPGGARRDGPGGGRREGGPGRGRGGPPPRQVERKLYSVDAVVDRGFEDVEEDAGTRRVHWTIVKRTTADQVSRKALAAVYVLQREGADSEFPSLGAARSAVNKTIVHPEKLTRSKAEYAAEKK
jgi:hypothetical protein